MPKFDLSPRQLRSIVAVSELRNISHAAVELSVTQPSLSRTIAKIETELGVELFHRDSSGATPTEAGTRLATRAAEVLRQLEDIEDEMRSIDGKLHGRISVAMPDTIGHALFLPLLDRFAAEHQDVEFRVIGAHPNHVPLALSAGEADVGVVSSAHQHQGLEIRALVTEKLHLVGPPSSRSLGPVDLKSVVGLPLALPGIQPGLRQLIDRAFANMGLRPTVVIEADTQDTLLELIRDGRAYSIMAAPQRVLCAQSRLNSNTLSSTLRPRLAGPQQHRVRPRTADNLTSSDPNVRGLTVRIIWPIGPRC